MRTTIDIPDQDHALFIHLARASDKTLSQLIVELARRGLQPVAETEAEVKIDPRTGFRVFRSNRPVTSEDVQALLDEIP